MRPSNAAGLACRSLGCAALLLASLTSAQVRQLQPTAATLPLVVAEGRQLAVLHPAPQPSAAAKQSAAIAASSFESGTQRIHVVRVDGQTYRAATPLDGPRSRILFDPARRAFASLLPSIRLELAGGADAEAVGEALGATRVTVFERLGFAVIDLPRNLHPLDAVDQARALPGRPEASVRLRSPTVEWR